MKIAHSLALLTVALCLCVSSADPSLADTFGSGDKQFDIEFVTIGNPGNPADTTGTRIRLARWITFTASASMKSAET